MVQKSFTFGKPPLGFDRRAQHADCDLSFTIDKSPFGCDRGGNRNTSHRGGGGGGGGGT